MTMTKKMFGAMMSQEKKNSPIAPHAFAPRREAVIHPPEATPEEKMTPTSFAGIRKMMGKI